MKNKNIKKTVILTVSAATLLTTSAPILNYTVAHADDSIVNNVNNNNNNNSSSTNSSSSSVDSSSSSVTQTKQHTLSRPYVVFGTGTSQNQQNQLEQIFETQDVANVKTMTAGASAYNKYLNNGQSSGTTDAAMISSVAIAPADPGSGIKVNIKKYNGKDNITQVTAQQYAMVAQMAGVTDVTITVSAPTEVSGESALTGVYAALNEDGASINPENTASANSMLDATQAAIKDNSNDSSYPGKLMTAVGNTTKDIAQQKQDGQNPNEDQIKDMLDKNLQKQGIEGQTSSGNVTNIVNALVKFNNSPISSDKTFLNNVGNTISNIKGSTGDVMNKAKNIMGNPEVQGFWQKVKTFFMNLFGNHFS